MTRKTGFISRRSVVGGAAAAAAGPVSRSEPATVDPRGKLLTTSTHWGTYLAEVHGETIRAIHPFPADPDPSPIGQSLIDGVRHRSRIEKPMVRKGWLDNGPQGNVKGRGAEPFVALEWEDAIPLVARELGRIKKRYGNEALYAGSYGWSSAGRLHHATSQLRRFLNLFGGHVWSRNTYSTAAAEVIAPHVAAPFFDLCIYKSTTWSQIAAHTELMVTFGGMSLKNAQVSAGGISTHDVRPAQEAMVAAGVEVVNIGPLKEDVFDGHKAQWLKPRPNTDTAIMLGMAHTLIIEGLHDQAFLTKYCVGFEKFEAYVLGKSDGRPKTARWAADISRLDADTISALARKMARKRTLISASWSVQRADNGEQPIWMVMTLAAMLGQIGLPGGGFGFGFGASGVTGNPGSPVRPMAVPRRENQVKSFIPVARISDMLLNPGETVRYNGQTLTYPDIHMVYWTGGNPFHHHQDLVRMRRAWRKPETVIVHDSWWTPIARHADIVLPATLTTERNDLGASVMDPYMIAMKQLVPPIGEARNDQDIFADVAEELGFRGTFMAGRDEMGWVRWMYDATIRRAEAMDLTAPSFDEFWERGWCKFPELPERTLMSDFRADPDAAPLSTPTGRLEIFSETIASWDDDSQPGHAVWHEPEEWLGAEKSKVHPLHLISNQPKHRLHSQYDMGRVSQAAKVQGKEPVSINSKDAADRGIRDGDVVRLFNDRGACLAGAVVTDNIAEGVVKLSTGAWYDPLDPADEASMCVHGNANILTRDSGTSVIAQGPSPQSCLVELEKWTQPIPPIKVFDPPVVIESNSTDI